MHMLTKPRKKQKPNVATDSYLQQIPACSPLLLLLCGLLAFGSQGLGSIPLTSPLLVHSTLGTQGHAHSGYLVLSLQLTASPSTATVLDLQLSCGDARRN
jgi:hypothetical protein